jgi:hypothetical protein
LSFSRADRGVPWLLTALGFLYTPFRTPALRRHFPALPFAHAFISVLEFTGLAGASRLVAPAGQRRAQRTTTENREKQHGKCSSVMLPNISYNSLIEQPKMYAIATTEQ